MFCFNLPTTAKTAYLDALQRVDIPINELEILTGKDWTYVRCSDDTLYGRDTLSSTYYISDQSLYFMQRNLILPCVLIAQTKEIAQMLVWNKKQELELVRRALSKLPAPFDYSEQLERYRVASLLDVT